MKPTKVKLSVPVPKTPKSAKPKASHPHFKRPKMSVMGKSAYGTGKSKMAFPNLGGAAAMLGGGGAAPMGPGGPPPMPGDGAAPMPPNAAPDNIGG